MTCRDVYCEGQVQGDIHVSLSRFAGDFCKTKLVTSGFSLRSNKPQEKLPKSTLRVIISVGVSQSVSQSVSWSGCFNCTKCFI